MSHKWADFFLQGCAPHMVPLSNQTVRDPKDFKRFQCDDAWELGRRLRDDMPGLHSIMVLKLKVNGVATLVAKTFFGKEYFESINQIDPFLDESRAYEHILLNCPSSRLSYFPTYHGVILDLTREKYPRSYALRPRAIVLERVEPSICCPRNTPASRLSSIRRFCSKNRRSASL
ncbi:hypothetical protein BP00DRAFT_223306 [Aspergillus indologenus CBS 114.80]|uniref:Uncharacterized protein n=1 Tax=Aspergillus indologenus CBS 114.80 TaxID=1450541 RepID=A0A2V5IMU3_9EURO|nr:hypothetical protein BP00DRAFT_223306 [Aspergillus indologenus CBS 114.80]